VQGPLSRFGDTAANSGMLALLDEFESTRELPVSVKTVAASSAAAAWRIFLMRTYESLADAVLAVGCLEYLN
jgi:hypothetical protein